MADTCRGLIRVIAVAFAIFWGGIQGIGAAAVPTSAHVAAPAHSAAQTTAFDCTTVSEIPPAQCRALVALYTGTNGPAWTNSSGWLANMTPCSWFGVTCQAGHVTALTLDDNQLRGAIPLELGNLLGLQRLELRDNQLSGGIPLELGALTALTSLRLESNQLSGGIPSVLGNLSNLQDLYLSHNQLSGGIPLQLGSLPYLGSLMLDDNHLSGEIPAQLGNLANLYSLHLDHNQLSGSIPSQLGNLAKLRYLLLNSNPLHGELPRSLMTMPLSWFYFHNTGLCEPGDAAFQAWLAGIAHLNRSGAVCRARAVWLPLIMAQR